MINLNLKKRLQTSFFLFVVVTLMIKFNLISVYVLIIFSVISVLEFINICRKLDLHKAYKYFLNTFFVIYIFIFCYLFLYLSNHLILKTFLYIILFGCAASDIGGYLFGKLFKGPKLSKISPKKTYSGAFGSVILSCLIISSLLFFFTNFFSFTFFIIAIITSISCQLGDLLFSLLKRKAKIKDYGSFLPGHGGLLDRVDGILLGLPIGLISLIFLI